MPPVAAEAVIAYGLEPTPAPAAVPALVSVTLPIVSPCWRPDDVKSDSVGVWPYVYVTSEAVTDSRALLMTRLPGA